MDLKPDSLVSPVPQLLGILMSDGRHVPSDRLGPGIVKRIESDGHALVYWADADADAFMDPTDLQLLGTTSHLVTISRLNAQGVRLNTRHKIVTSRGSGIEHNWQVELLPKGVIRTLRSDGCKWTFDWNSLLGRMNLMHNTNYPPPSNEEAEALTVAEFAIK